MIGLSWEKLYFKKALYGEKFAVLCPAQGQEGAVSTVDPVLAGDKLGHDQSHTVAQLLFGGAFHREGGYVEK